MRDDYYYDEELGYVDEEEIEKRLKILKLPTANEYFAASVQPPYIVYLTPHAEYYGADGVNMMRDQTFRVELVTKSKDIVLQNELFKLFSDIPFRVQEESGGQRNYYLTTLEFEQTLPIDYVDDDE